MNNIIVDKTYLVEIPVAASSTAQTYYFPVLNNLDGKLVQGLSTYPVGALTKSPTNVAVANQNLLQVSYLQLVVGDVNQLWNIPLIDLVTIQKTGGVSAFNPFAMEFNNLRVIWAKSFVFVADTTTIVASASSFVFNIKYIDDPKR